MKTKFNNFAKASGLIMLIAVSLEKLIIWFFDEVANKLAKNALIVIIIIMAGRFIAKKTFDKTQNILSQKEKILNFIYKINVFLFSLSLILIEIIIILLGVYMEDFRAILEILIWVIGTAIPFTVALIMSIKKTIKEKNWTKIETVLPEFIIKAEQFLNYKGAEKKEYVKTQLGLFCIENGIHFDHEKFEKEIDKIVELTKKVNARDKDIPKKEVL